jgi:Tetratricopeptide repeat
MSNKIFSSTLRTTESGKQVRRLEGSDILVDLWPAPESANDSTLVVTFTPWVFKIVEEHGFGASIFHTEGMEEVNFIARKNHWYQTYEMIEAIQYVDAHVVGGKRRIGYGGSMGAYAAINYAQALKLETVIAISPQYSIDRAKVPFEKRWSKEAGQIQFSCDHPEIGLEYCREVYAVFDPNVPADLRHIDLIQSQLDIHGGKLIRLEIPDGGHSCGFVLGELRMIKPLVLSIAKGTFDAESFKADLAARIQSSASHWSMRGLRLRFSDPVEALACVEKAMSLNENEADARIIQRCAQTLTAIGQTERAEKLINVAIAEQPKNALGHLRLCQHFMQLGKFDEAHTALNQALQLSPTDSRMLDLKQRLTALTKRK